MTPLARRLVSWSLDPKMVNGKHWGTPGLREWVIDHLTDTVAFFETSAVVPLVKALAQEIANDWTAHGAVDDTFAFLPAPEGTWIEFMTPGGNSRAAIFMEDDTAPGEPENAFAKATIFLQSAPNFVNARCPCCRELIVVGPRSGRAGRNADDTELVALRGVPDFLPKAMGNDPMEYGIPHYWAELMVINSPNVIERTAHAPHRGLIRELRKADRPSGLRPWHQILLSITREAREAVGEAGHRASPCEHFVRTHTRRIRGRLEPIQIPRHKRGDPSIGIARAFYKVVP